MHPPSTSLALRSPHGTCSGQVLPRHTGGSPYRCSLPGLAGFDDSRCVGPNPQRRPVRLNSTRGSLERGFNPALADCGLQGTATSPSSTATLDDLHLARHLTRTSGSGGSAKLPRRQTWWRRGWDSNPRHRVYPVHGISSAAPSAARSPLLWLSPARVDCSSAGLARAILMGEDSEGARSRPPPTQWRRGEDLNPRGAFWAPIRFRVGRLQPGSATPPDQRSNRFVSKNAVRSSLHSSSRTPPSTLVR